MTHLTPEEFVDAVDDVLAPSGRTHLAECPSCRREVQALAALLREASATEVPEPSPLFWELLSARVRTAVAETDAGTRPGSVPWWRWPAVAPLGALAAVLFALVATVADPTPHPPVPDLRGAASAEDAAVSAAPPTAPAAAPLAPGAEVMRPGEDSGQWAVVAELVGALDWETAGEAGLSVLPGDTDRAVLFLSPDEQQELSRLLQGELARSKS